MKTYKNYLVACDLDGTLLNDHKRIDIKTLEFLKKMMRKGLHFTIATSRPYEVSQKYAKILQTDMPFVVSSGSMLYDFKKKEVIYADILDKNILPLVLKEYTFKDVFLHTTKGILLSKKSIRYKQFKKEDPLFEPIIIEEANLDLFDYSQITVLPYNPKEFIVKYNNLLQDYDLNIFECGNGAVAIVKKGISKASGLLYLAEIYNINKDKVFVFGDNYNDLEMIKTFKNSYAMGNSDDDIKKIASYITLDNNHNGVLKALKKIFS